MLSWKIIQISQLSRHLTKRKCLLGPALQLYALYNTSMVAVAPLLSGAGVKGKVNQAMKLGVPVVATPIAIEGTGAQDGRECLVASDPEGFAAKVAQVYTDCALWGRLAEAGYRNVQRHFSREMGGPALLQVRIVAGWLRSRWACGGLSLVVPEPALKPRRRVGQCRREPLA